MWRLDDDNIPEHDVLEKLVSCIDDKAGAIAGCVLDPKQGIEDLPSGIPHNEIESISGAPNIQWMKWSGVKKVEHLYSSFIFRKKAQRH